MVSVRKGCLFALAVSIFGIDCASYSCMPPRNPLISLPEQKIPPFRFRNWINTFCDADRCLDEWAYSGPVLVSG